MRRDCFELEALDPTSLARAGWLTDRSGQRLATPLFQPVATSASLKTLDWADLEKIGYRHVLMNTYHLVVDPGSELTLHPYQTKEYTADWDGRDRRGRPIHGLCNAYAAHNGIGSWVLMRGIAWLNGIVH